MLNSDLAKLYVVETKVLNQAVKRNIDRFPSDFMFQLSWEETTNLLRSQIVTLKKEGSKRGKHIKYQPFAFTEQGVAMLSSVLKSKTAIKVNIEIMRAFVSLRKMIITNAELSHRLDKLEKRYDSHFREVFEAIKQLMDQPAKKKNSIGFVSTDN